MPRVCKRFAHCAENALFLSGVALLIAFAVSELSARLYSRKALAQFERYRQGAIPVANAAANPERLDFTLWSPGRIKAYQMSLGAEDEAPIAVLEIDKIHLRVPVFVGTTDLALDRGSGWIKGTAPPGSNGNVAIAGHRDGFFRGLKDIIVGDTIRLETLTEIDSYVVNQIEIVNPKDVRVLEVGDAPRITLVTCYPFYYVGSAPQRYIVRGTKTVREVASHVRR